MPSISLEENYIGCLKLKPSNVNEIVGSIFKDDTVDTSFVLNYKQTIYASLTRLIKKGIVESFIKDGVKFYKMTS